MNRFELYKDYKESDIAMHPDNISYREYGIGVIGHDFIVLQHDERDQSIAFMLSGVMGNDWIYTCIYTDFNTSNPIKALEVQIESLQRQLTDALNKQ